MKQYDIAIVGGGPSGIMATITVSKFNSNLKIALLEKNNSLAKKLLISGGGRANLSHKSDMDDYISAFSTRFIKASLYNFNHEDLINLFKEKGLEFKEEDSKLYPVTDDSNSVLNVLISYLNELNIDIFYNFNVVDIKKEDDLFKIYKNDSSKISSYSFTKKNENLANFKREDHSYSESLSSKKLILTCGGMTYPETGSDGTGYDLAKSLGHNIVSLSPALTSIGIENSKFYNLSGLKFEDPLIKYKKTIKSRDDVLITHKGLTGPGILNISEDILRDILFDNKYKTVSQDIFEKNEANLIFESKRNILFKPNSAIYLDFIPDLNNEELKSKLDSDFKKSNKIKNYLKYHLANSFIPLFLEIANIDGNKILNQLNKKERKSLLNNLKNFKIEFNSFSKNSAMLSSGGVNLNEVNQKTMESKIVDGLYFAGELLDLSAPTGGYNLQIAFSTGYLAGLSCENSLKKLNNS